MAVGTGAVVSVAGDPVAVRCCRGGAQAEVRSAEALATEGRMVCGSAEARAGAVLDPFTSAETEAEQPAAQWQEGKPQRSANSL